MVITVAVNPIVMRVKRDVNFIRMMSLYSEFFVLNFFNAGTNKPNYFLLNKIELLIQVKDIMNSKISLCKFIDKICNRDNKLKIVLHDIIT
ncbi:hypothetical protein XBJ2_1860038 [Xenorhabdus bovienii str. Jollieti]|uniref:Uncharacterized protein n=1 Tax=Xenorhabdus bovienii (strain SS-2004) TaxID=406818 RepID=D3V523_XENBS|nr:hypothetical protein XBJ1_3634 [Xenorhabdus bovienii SS-2004]CDH28535.1 hypothetical protein XBJ2_1860038 [Xenorhabdus bovienii str. Jollieti]